MNAIDLIVLIFLIAAIKRGSNEGIGRIFAYIGGASGLLLGAWIAPHLVTPVSGQLNRLLIILIIELTLASILSTALRLVAHKLEPHIHRFRVRPLAKFLGITFEVVLTLFIIRLAASLFSNVRTQDIGKEIRQSFSISTLDTILPPAPDILARIEKAINLNGFPDAFIGQEPQRETVIVNGTVDRSKIDTSLKSVVMIYGFGCGGIVEGSGFVISPGIVVTNAHVVAGVSKPKIQGTDKSYTATPVFIDKDLDVAVLRVPGLTLPALVTNQTLLATASPVVAAGYPGGGSLTLSGGAIIDETRALGRDIHNRGVVTRDIYEFQADVQSGNSGGPLFDAEGRVVGIVFAKSVTQENIGYAIRISQAIDDIQTAQTKTSSVSTGRCTSE